MEGSRDSLNRQNGMLDPKIELPTQEINRPSQAYRQADSSIYLFPAIRIKGKTTIGVAGMSEGAAIRARVLDGTKPEAQGPRGDPFSRSHSANLILQSPGEEMEHALEIKVGLPNTRWMGI